MEKINFEAGTIVTPAKVNEDKTITPAVWEGKTPLSPFMLNKLQENIENDQIEQNTVIDELKAKTIKCLQEVETPTPVSGASIDLSDSADAKITELKISGNSKQETRSGKNLLPINVTDKTTNGITITKNSNGTYTLNGTATTDFTFELYSGSDITLLAGTYTGQLGQMLGFYIRKDNGDYQTLADTIIKTNTFTITEDFIYNRIYIYISSGDTFSNSIITPMLEEGSTATDYEPYGAMPSPDYPSEVECCGDNVNLFDINDMLFIDNAATSYLLSNNTLKVTNTTNNQNTYVRYKVLDIRKLAGKTLTISANAVCSSNNVACMNLGYCDLNGGNRTSIGYSTSTRNGQIYYTFTLPSELSDTQQCLFILFYGSYGVEKVINSTVEYSDIKIEKGTKVTPYSPYGQGCINEVICNKNLVVEIQKGYWNNTGVFDSDNNFCSSKQIKVEPGKTYVGSLFDKNKKYVGKLVYTVFDKNKNFIRYSGEDTITIANNEKYVSLRTYTSQLSYVTNNNLLMQLEEGSTATPYHECQPQTYTIPTQQPIRAIKKIRDTFIKKNNKWYERHPVIRKIFDGSENWTWFNTGDSGLTGSTTASISLDNMISGNFLNGYCSHFVVGTSKLINTLRLGANNNTIYFYLKDTQFDNISIWTAWLKEQYEAGTPVYVDYVLAKPLDIECTEEQSTILFDIEQNAKTYDKVTHMYSTDNVSPVIDVTYKKDIETLFANTLIEEVG